MLQTNVYPGTVVYGLTFGWTDVHTQKKKQYMSPV